MCRYEQFKFYLFVRADVVKCDYNLYDIMQSK
jgi:hypothetical protein